MENEKHEQICRRLRFQTEELVKTVWSQFDCTYASRGIEMIIYLKFNDSLCESSMGLKQFNPDHFNPAFCTS
jgi:hypothetical protein